jgi:hypothetical protein
VIPGETALAETGGTGFGLTSSPAEVETLDALRKSVATLKAKAPEEADAYRGFVLEVAESVAAAAKGGETAESGTLEKIRSALRDDSRAVCRCRTRDTLLIRRWAGSTLDLRLTGPTRSV